jgi:hypothetical protein
MVRRRKLREEDETPRGWLTSGKGSRFQFRSLTPP